MKPLLQQFAITGFQHLKRQRKKFQKTNKEIGAPKEILVKEETSRTQQGGSKQAVQEVILPSEHQQPLEAEFKRGRLFTRMRLKRAGIGVLP